MTPEQIERIKQLVADLSDEADLCRSETCDDFANLLWRAMDAIEFLLIRAQAARAEQTGWISVEEELPECDCRVYLDIVYIDEEGERTIGEGLYVPNVGFSFIKPTVRGGELDWDECEINTVNHWKYSDTLPPLPEGDSA